MNKFLLEKFSFFFRQYKKIPFSVRTRIHNFLDWFNENKYLLALIGPTRHRITHKNLSASNSPLKLIVGESYRRPGWFISNYQVFALHFLDVRREFCKKNHLTHIYADNVIEHLTASAGQTFLQNSYNALGVGGKLRLATPDSSAIAKAYLGKDKKKIYEMSVGEILVGIKDTWFEILDDLLQQNFTLDIFTRGTRLFFIGLTLVLIIIFPSSALALVAFEPFEAEIAEVGIVSV
jgi:hypothetical protein